MNRNNARFIEMGNWNWQAQKLKEQYGQLTLSDVTFKFGTANDLFNRIGTRLNKTIPEVISILKRLRNI